MRCTQRLQIERRALRDDEREECQRILDFCQRKLAESPEPRTLLGRLVGAFTETKRLREIRKGEVEFNRRILQAEFVEVLHCKPLAVIHIAEYEDEGHHYFFDVGEKTLFFFGGQDYPPSKKFPNNNFELVRVTGECVFRVNRLGGKLTPVRKIVGRAAKELSVCSSEIFSFPGDLDSAEEDYRRHIQQADPESLREWC